MPDETTGEPGASRGEASSAGTPATSESASVEPGPELSPSPAPGRRRSARRRLPIGALGALVLAVVRIFGNRWILASLDTVSRDDAYVDGQVSFVAARAAGQVTRVLADDNNRVRKGELLPELEKAPFEDAVAVKRAAVDIAAANLRAAKATLRDLEAQARVRRRDLQTAIQDVDNKIPALHAPFAALGESKANLTLAQAGFYRAPRLLGTPAESRQERDRAQTALSTSGAQVTGSLAEVYQTRSDYPFATFR